MQDLKDTLKQETTAALLAYNMNRGILIQTAMREGGPAAVAKLEDEFTALCNADFALTQATLNERHRQYQNLMDEATVSGDHLKQSILELESAANVLDAMAQTVTLIGRLLLMLSI